MTQESMLAINTEEEKKEILRKYRRLLRYAKTYLQDGDAKLIKKAFNTSMEAHKEMRRKSGEPYIYHPLAVAEIAVNEIGLGTTSIISALLHDVVEDTEIELEDIEREFGPKIARIIDGLTKISGVFEYGTSQQAENFRKMLLTLSDDVRVILIKLADRLHNMRTLDSMPNDKQLKIASETIYLYAPLAHRLGLYAIKTELEDLYLKYTQAEKYREIASDISATRDARNRFIKRFIAPIQKELKNQGLHNFVIKGRPKSIYSIWSKMNKKSIPFSEVYDLFAVRIILDVPNEEEKAACWKVYSIITDFYNPNPERLRDWISTPKSNGYESLHTTVMGPAGQWVEVQIRTKRMDEIAEKGYAAHWKYKDKPGSNRQNGLEEWISMVRDLLEQTKKQTNSASAIEFVDDFRSNLFTEEVFVFTPKGDLRILPSGATALDFAFDIHTEIGAKCLGAKVNQKLVPINYILSNGDQVEILTSNKQRPSEDWLRFVVSSKAKSKIKEVLKEEKKAAAVEGKEIVRRKLKQLKIDLNSEVIEKLTSYFKIKSPLEFYYRVGEGIIPATSIKKFYDDSQKVNGSEYIKVPEIRVPGKNLVKPGKEQKKDLILIGEEMDVLDYKLAKCCNPIPGDDVFGFVTVNEGIKIHRTNCPNAPELMSNYGYRIVQAKWTTHKELAFLTGLKVVGTDRMGLINDITEVISSELKVNMRSISIDTDEGIFEGNIMLYVHDKSHLATLIKKLEKVSGIVRVSRFDSE